ncbi:MAG: FAD-binding oxidoreductase [archaeon]|nr:FAD-binding oxidoreductase [archaeon]
MILKNYWEDSFKDFNSCESLKGEINCDFLVVGGGIAGLHAALFLSGKGDVVLIEKNLCGEGSTGKSSAFLMPDSEMELKHFIRWHGLKEGKEVWGIPEKGVNLIVKTAKKYNLRCDLKKEDSLFLAVGKKGLDAVISEGEARKKAGFPYKLYNIKSLTKILGAKNYAGGIRYGTTWTFHPVKYIQELKKILLKKGVRIYENTEAKSISKNKVYTSGGCIKGRKIILSIAIGEKRFRNTKKYAYHTQSYIAVSRPLRSKEIKSIYPSGKIMCWDTLLAYNYYRILPDNRFLYGGSSALTAYLPFFVKSKMLMKFILRDFRKHYPSLKDLKFEFFWGGFVPTSKDLIPVVDYDSENKDILYVLGCAGLPWAAFCGDYAARKILNQNRNCDKYFKKEKNFFIPHWMESILPRAITFSINNLYSKYYQKDK